ncbi:hypothetical protein Esi_1192_0001 [Ectocarpus siliculosus]|uniref:Uncharacterized protein n=1 Tax=Ectocarpus siliculosus TaxID=2880 RepID=D7FIE6_ECTSI|nr:hypothetical protein Esi_0033_0079 [Ectocarpus siliculosus]CBJ34168.1 hypothetical protein Esi_1192_0001 [Ectocarpus siliculosus]|eukprot:CBJ26448.1 hypothetical protein Esi_0033_0079 [Ectocarpus siliculosus]
MQRPVHLIRFTERSISLRETGCSTQKSKRCRSI